MLEKHVFLTVLRRRLVAAAGAPGYRLTYGGERAGGDPRGRQGGSIPELKKCLKRAILAHPFQSQFIGARVKGVENNEFSTLLTLRKRKECFRPPACRKRWPWYCPPAVSQQEGVPGHGRPLLPRRGRPSSQAEVSLVHGGGCLATPRHMRRMPRVVASA